MPSRNSKNVILHHISIVQIRDEPPPLQGRIQGGRKRYYFLKVPCLISFHLLRDNNKVRKLFCAILNW